ncbi:MAG: hypothetical protein AUJ12_05635 [Alphaproteobacteria bacterium CG1_02_46_17]|nr:MAG: hypothetical protein AUJ12_05635 [Alphaproteobacteria bacterium CG1_02_46_17]
MKTTNNNHPEFRYLLNKIEWPTPDAGLPDIICMQVLSGQCQNIIETARRSPMLTIMSVLLALFLGISSGFAFDKKAQATDTQIAVNPYTMSMTGVYYAHISKQQ